MHILLMYSTHSPSQEHISRLQGIDPSIQVSVADSVENAIKHGRTADIIFGHRYLAQCLPYGAKIRWVQSTAGGVDRLPLAALARQHIQLSAMNIFSPVVARHAVTLGWALSRCLPQCLQQQASGIWNNRLDWPPWPRRAFILGAGELGCAVARILRTDGFEVEGAKRTMADSPGKTANFHKMYDRTSWRMGLASADWCILALPNSDETRGLIDESALRALPSHAILINIGRGETLDTEALCRVLWEGHLAGAALDVIHPKPQGPGDPVWKTPRLVITPHCAAHYRERPDMLERFCENQLLLYIKGLPVSNLVNLDTLLGDNG